MKFLFLNRKFPGDFLPILEYFSQNSQNDSVFIANINKEITIPKLRKLIYIVDKFVSYDENYYMREYKNAFIHSKIAEEAALKLKRSGFIPDVIFAHSPQTNAMFIKEFFPDKPLITLFDWFYNPCNSEFDFFNKNRTENEKVRLKCKNTTIIHDLLSCDVGICHSNWQKQQIPKEFHNKIKVIPQGIDTNFFKPDNDAVFQIPNTNIFLTPKDKVIIYSPAITDNFNGFPQFIEMVNNVLKKYNDIHIILNDNIYSGISLETLLKGNTYKKLMFEKYKLDISRFHIVSNLEKEQYLRLLQISSVNVYLSYPTAIYKSLYEAMSTEVITVASKAQNTQEIINDNQNGFLVDFFDVDELTDKIEYVINNKEKLKEIQNNARNTIINSYNLNKSLGEIDNIINAYLT